MNVYWIVLHAIITRIYFVFTSQDYVRFMLEMLLGRFIDHWLNIKQVCKNRQEKCMELLELIRPGMNREDTFLITLENSAIHLGSGSSRVLATPWMIAFMERVSHRLLTCCLPEGFSSVGTHLDVHHLAPTPVGATIRVKAEVLSLDGNRIYFSVEAWDDLEKIGEGKHERVVIDEARFLRRVEKKVTSV